MAFWRIEFKKLKSLENQCNKYFARNSRKEQTNVLENLLAFWRIEFKKLKSLENQYNKYFARNSRKEQT
ncbi:MAG: hypothetical protein EBQ94_10910, partial [Flavobacteriales bacterium]|nr:hypothetical protein [Flavobacteriales bacterium]